MLCVKKYQTWFEVNSQRVNNGWLGVIRAVNLQAQLESNPRKHDRPLNKQRIMKERGLEADSAVSTLCLLEPLLLLHPNSPLGCIRTATQCVMQSTIKMQWCVYLMYHRVSTQASLIICTHMKKLLDVQSPGIDLQSKGYTLKRVNGCLRWSK